MCNNILMICTRCHHDKHDDEFSITRKGTPNKNCKACVAYLTRPNVCRRCRGEFPAEEFKIGNRKKPITMCRKCDQIREKAQKRLLLKMKSENLDLASRGEIKCLRCHAIKPVDSFKDLRGVVMNRCESCREYMKAHVRSERKAWTKERREESYQKQSLARRALREEVLAAYGGFCQCCGEDTYEFLAIDHVDGDGGTHRRKLKADYQRGEVKAAEFYPWLKANGYPHGYQILCHNCNNSKGLYGTCPHRKMKLLPVETHGLGPMVVRSSGVSRKIQ